MTTILIYGAAALGAFVLVAVLIKRLRAGHAGEDTAEEDYAQGLWDGPCLNWAERLFDSTDYLWLRRSIGFPDLARKLARSRKQMVLKWLRCLRRAFEQLMSTPDAATEGQPEDGLRSWHLLWLTLRFQLLVGYAILMVKVFGPYHRLLPSLDWIALPSEAEHRRDTYQPAGTGRVP